MATDLRLPEPTKETVTTLNEQIRDYARVIQDTQDSLDRLTKELKFRIAIRNAVQEHLKEDEEE